jgi:hypothetical protein
MSRINRWFITFVRRTEMIVIDLGYRKVVLTKEKAMQLIECLEGAEQYEDKYWSETKRRELGMTESYTYHVYPLETGFSLTILGDSKYQLAKLAGKPTE